MKTFNDDPNFSIVAPGGCNANCSFCFNKDKKGIETIRFDKYILSLLSTLKTLPDNFYQISITGNEPMISPNIFAILKSCELFKGKYSNILLTTNGTNLLEYMDKVSSSVHHINVSRHHYDFEENKKIFKGTWNVSDEYLEEAIDLYGAKGIDISLNCVINDATTKEFIFEYIAFAKRIGAYAIRFRKENGDVSFTDVEKLLDNTYPIIQSNKCPVCRTDLRVIKGFDTFWKSSTLEPSDTIKNEVYEVVFDVDGQNYLDWNRKKKIDVSKIGCKKVEKQNFCNYTPTYFSNSCGGSRGSCGGSRSGCGSTRYSSSRNSCGGSSSRC